MELLMMTLLGVLIGVLIIIACVGLLRWVLGTSKIICLLEQILQETQDCAKAAKKDFDS